MTGEGSAEVWAEPSFVLLVAVWEQRERQKEAGTVRIAFSSVDWSQLDWVYAV